VSFPAIAETRNYARDNSPLSRIRYTVENIISNMDEQEFFVQEVLEEKGLIGYLCTQHNPANASTVNPEEILIPELDLNCFVQLSTPRQRLLSGQFDGNSAFRLRLETLNHLNRLQQSPVAGLQGARAELLPHQIYIANEVAKRHAPRVLLADEVGLGKTIEAGMILHQLIHTSQAQRILILVPESLLHQWLVEMLRRFNLTFALFNKQRLEALSMPSVEAFGEEDIIDDFEQSNPFSTEQRILTSLDLLLSNPLTTQQALEAEWDLVIIDEAHHLQWSEQSTSSEYGFVEQLAKVCDGLLLLTATPEQVGIESHFARLRLLDPDRFFDLATFKKEEQGFQRLNKSLEGIQQLIEGTTDQQISDEIVKTVSLLLPENLQQNFIQQTNDKKQLKLLINQLLDQHGTGRILFRNTRSSFHSSSQGFPERELHHYPLPCPILYQNQRTAPVTNKQRLHPEHQFQEDEWINVDPRVEWLQKLLKSLKLSKALVICHHADTAKALDKFLNLRAGIRCTSFYPGLSIIERDRAAAYFADSESGAQVLVCSEIGSEGRNFQFAHHLVLFDLPLNPDLIEQRIGRLDRIGQQQTIQIHVPYIQQTAQEVIFNWYNQGLDLFQHSCSAGFAIYENFAELLQIQLLNPETSQTTLINETAEYRNKISRQMQEGRDRLLELNSCDPEKADELIEGIVNEEQSTKLNDYMVRVFDEFGVDHDYHSEHALVIKPTDHMRSEHFPGLNEEGNTITFNRKKALSREDIEFLSWEHPMVVEIMEMISSSDIGNAAVTSISIHGLKQGTLLLESCFTVERMAPANLQLQRYLPVQPLRFLVDTKGKNLTKVVSHQNLNQMAKKLLMRVSRPIVEQVRNEIEQMILISQELAEVKLPEIIQKAKSEMQESLGVELSRLISLKKVNPNIRDIEIDFLQQQISDSSDYIHKAKLQLQGIRLIINT
ncbi:MAG: RNA polymerase-associated protein RapA, partial [Gammaproteobacteria bacterium]|nr:RNA polymerase-associated protein RapA [Gammaproteobacteria bacterium]